MTDVRSPLRVYYGHDPNLIEDLRNCEILVFEPRGWSSQDLARLQASGGPKLLGYLSCFAWPDWAGPTSWWWGSKTRDEQWNAWWYSLSSWGWRRQVAKLWTAVKNAGCDGIFFDNLDRLDQDPQSKPHFARLLTEIRKDWPQSYFMGNRGLEHLLFLCPLMDAILFENLSDQGFSRQDYGWIESKLTTLKNAPDTEVYALDYESRFHPQESHRLLTLFPEIQYARAPDEGLQGLA